MQVAAAVIVRLEAARALELQVVLVEGARSAAPPISHGTLRRDRVQHLADAVARRHAFGVGREGRNVRCPSRRAACARASVSSSRASSGYCVAIARRKLRCHSARSALRRARRCLSAKCSCTPSGTRNVRPPASRRHAWRASTSSSPSGSPCASLRVLLVAARHSRYGCATMISVGRSVGVGGNAQRLGESARCRWRRPHAARASHRPRSACARLRRRRGR